MEGVILDRISDSQAVLLCASCKRKGQCHFGLTSERVIENGISQTHLVCPTEYEGGPGVAHGGWISAVLDEILGHLPSLHGKLAVTATLKIDFLRPVPVGRGLEAKAWCDKIENERWHNVGELRLLSSGAVLARAEGVFVERSFKHFEKHKQWLATQD